MPVAAANRTSGLALGNQWQVQHLKRLEEDFRKKVTIVLSELVIGLAVGRRRGLQMFG